MGLSMKNLDVKYALKNPIFTGGGGFTKKQYKGGNCLKRGAWTVCRLKEGLGENEGVVFFMGGGGELIPQCTQ